MTAEPSAAVNSIEREFLMVLDSLYLPRALVLYGSLAAVSPSFRLRVYCMDEPTERILRKLALPGVDLVGVSEIEGDVPELPAVRGTRSRQEYCWTTKPAALLHALRRERALEMLTLLDADLYFYADPAILLRELGPRDSILLVPHRYPPEWEHWAFDSGEYNSGFISFRNDADGLDALQWWSERCLEWCHHRVEPERFGSQRYLHDWPTSRPGVHVLRHPGGGLAPWNMRRHRVELRDDSMYVDGWPLVFFHFQSLRLYRGLALLRRYGFGASEFEITRRSRPVVWSTHVVWEVSASDRELLWHPYVRKLADALDALRRVEPGFDVRIHPPRELLRVATKLSIRAAIRAVVPSPLRHPGYRAYVALRRGVSGIGRAGAKTN